MTSNNKLKIAIIGSTGYTGLELIHILTKHPKVKILYLCATKKIGKKISYFDKRIKKKLPPISLIKNVDWSKLDLVFLSLPNGKAQHIIKNNFFKFKKLRYIYLSADFRIKNPLIYYNNYKINHKAKNLIKHSIYLISELKNKKINNYRIIANPGCYPTSIQLPLIPLIKKRMLINDITIDSKSGFSGAGKNLKKRFRHKNLFESTFAYNTKNHRHLCEIEQEFKAQTGINVNFSFNPHLLPTYRGILTSIYVKLNSKYSAKKVRNELIRFYKKRKFIKILKLNSEIGSGNVLNTNKCEISICETNINKKIIIFCAIDNLIKGAAGQAVQNMNLLLNYEESLGLK